MALLIKNGNVFFEDKFQKVDVLIGETKIVKIAPTIKLDCKTIDATNNYVLPGFIDIHVHIRDFELSYKEDWLSGSKAAAAGGITTMLDMPNNKIPFVTVDRLNEKFKVASEKSIVNFGAYIAATNDNVEEINNSDLKNVKLYYGETTGKIKVDDTEKIFKNLRKDILIIAHAEDNNIIEENKQMTNKNKLKYHSLVRDARAESTAVTYMIELSEKYDRNIHLTHISCDESMQLIIEAKKKGLKITCDTCPHYLFFDESLYEKAGNFAKVNPALKTKKDQEALWSHINNDWIDCMCSDHAPHTIDEKSGDYENCAAGFPGVQTTSQLMLNAVNEDKISLKKVISLLAKKPSEILKIKNKGEIKLQNDADLIVVDMAKEDIINVEKLFSKAGWSPYEQMKTKGKVITTIVNGKIVYDNEKIFEENKGKKIEFR